MTKDIVTRDATGRPTLIVYRQTADERANEEAERREHTERAGRVAASLRRTR